MIGATEDVAIYVPLIGQFDNIGDVILRRQLAARLSTVGQLNVLVGQAPDGFVEALQLPSGSRVHRSVASWYANALKIHEMRPCYFFKPGEVRFAMNGLREHIGALPLLIAIRARRGAVVNVGVGGRGSSRAAVALAAPALRLAHATYWRDEDTRLAFGFGRVIPDLAFAEGSSLQFELSDRDAAPYVVASFRADRKALSGKEAGALRAFADHHGCSIIIAPQVKRDGLTAPLLARRLGAEYAAWTSEDHLTREAELRALYRQARLVVSNRLHVLVAAVTEDAAIAGLGVDTGNKVARHLRQAGIEGVTACPPFADNEIEFLFSTSLSERLHRRRALIDARLKIDYAFADIRRATGLVFTERGGDDLNA
jgi:hypothetical protein